MSDKMMENLPNPPKYSAVVDANDDKHTLIRIDDGEYAGFVIKYNSIKENSKINVIGPCSLRRCRIFMAQYLSRGLHLLLYSSLSFLQV